MRRVTVGAINGLGFTVFGTFSVEVTGFGVGVDRSWMPPCAGRSSYVRPAALSTGHFWIRV